MLIGVISDTHGLLRPEAVAALAGVQHILHAGDVGNANILFDLGRIAPLTAIRGNIDRTGICADLPATAAIEFDGCLLYMLHSVDDLDIHPAAAGIRSVIYGHSHQPSVEFRDGVLFLNPGSAGPQRFRLPVSTAILRIDEGAPTAEIVLLPL
jgi:putative phosphoesterase